MLNKKVSVIIPTYNGEKYIKKSIESVLSQTFKDFEIIVIDDGSINDVYGVLKPYIEKNIIKYIRQENAGPGPARKNGILNSSGEYIACIDDDDVWIDNDKLKKQVEFLDHNNDYVVVGTCGFLFYEEDNEYANYNVLCENNSIKNKILIGNQFIQSSLLIRRNVLGDLSDYPIVKIGTAEDYILLLNIGLTGKMANLKEKMVVYTIRAGSITDKNRKSVIKNNIKTIKKYKGKYPNYYIALCFYIIKYFGYILIGLIKNKERKNMVLKKVLKLYRGLIIKNIF